GSTDREVLLTSYICHPSMANNELSGPLAIAFLYQQLKNIPNRQLTYRFFIGPETLGALYYLSKFGGHFTKRLEAGFVLTCCGDLHDLTFKKSRCSSGINTLVPHILAHKFGSRYSVREFFPMGSDERQYCSPGFDLPVACVTRSLYGEYKQYHTSKDDKSVIDFTALKETVMVMTDVCRAMELNGFYRNVLPYGEPQLGRRGLYPTLMSDLTREKKIERILYLLNYADGAHSLLDIAEKAGQPLLSFGKEIKALTDAGLLTKERVRV
ncbi:MAG: DUF4910 domain-containing protein, partial [Flavobacterium sp.]